MSGSSFLQSDSLQEPDSTPANIAPAPLADIQSVRLSPT